MKFCDEKIQEYLLNGGKIKRIDDKCRFEYREVMLIDDVLRFADEEKEPCEIGRSDLIANDWEIVEPEYDWYKIIEDKVLCVFNYIDDPNDLYGLYPILGYLIKYKPDEDYKFTGVMVDSCKADFRKCKPFNPTEYNIAKNLKDKDD